MKREEIKINKHMVFFPEQYEVQAIIDYTEEIPYWREEESFDWMQTTVSFEFLDDTIEELEDNDFEVQYIEYILYDMTRKHGNKGVVYDMLSYDEAQLYYDTLEHLWYAKDSLLE